MEKTSYGFTNHAAERAILRICLPPLVFSRYCDYFPPDHCYSNEALLTRLRDQHDPDNPLAQHLCITGYPGAGKTSLAKKLSAIFNFHIADPDIIGEGIRFRASLDNMGEIPDEIMNLLNIYSLLCDRLATATTSPHICTTGPERIACGSTAVILPQFLYPKDVCENFLSDKWRVQNYLLRSLVQIIDAVGGHQFPFNLVLTGPSKTVQARSKRDAEVQQRKDRIRYMDTTTLKILSQNYTRLSQLLPEHYFPLPICDENGTPYTTEQLTQQAIVILAQARWEPACNLSP